MILFLIFLISSLYLQQPRLAAAQNECQPTSCSPSGPIIRFPFRLTSRQPERCSYSGFDLSCNPTNNATVFNFQFPVRASARNIVLPVSAMATVREIDYATQVIRISVSKSSCFPGRVPELSSPPSPFKFHIDDMYDGAGIGYALFNCSGDADPSQALGPISCLRRGNYRVFACRSSSSVTYLSLSRCVKMYNISIFSEVLFTGRLSQDSIDNTYLHWPEPSPFAVECTVG